MIPCGLKCVVVTRESSAFFNSVFMTCDRLSYVCVETDARRKAFFCVVVTK